MVTDKRIAYNNSFSDELYQRFLKEIHDQYNHVPPFRIAESPLFVGLEFKKKVFDACREIAEVINRPDFKSRTEGSLSPEYAVPNEDDRTLFLQMDFGVCEMEDGSLEPMLIEVQGFPSLYFYQDMAANMYRKYFDIPEDYTHLHSGLDSESYMELMREAVVQDENPENVILLEVEPKNQVTRIDFLACADKIGVAEVCVSELIKEGKDVFYINAKGKKTQVTRIFNRVIFDELVGRKDLPRQFFFQDEANVTWAGHPNWFFRISKYTIPLLTHCKYVPDTFFLNQIDRMPKDLENYVLKPLYSFSGSGVIFNVTEAHIKAIEDPANYILQKKVSYKPVVQTPDGTNSKAEIRMLMIWDKNDAEPRMVNNLARLSKGEMIGVRYNKDKTWVGGSVAFFEKGDV